MLTTPTHRRHLALAAALLAAVLPLTACGDEKRTDAAPAAPRDTASTTPSAPGASPYVEPGAADGAPHYGENSAPRRPGDMSAADERTARAEAARMTPVLKRLWRQRKWDPDSVRATLIDSLGYKPRETTHAGKLLGGELEVREMYQRYEGDDYVTPEGAMIGLYIGDDACVTAYIQKTNYGARANGRFKETGCLEPPIGH
ncbi:hypothetical protein [Streptomyces sp. NPDC023327]|uniref:hypothetical protein n=1 Tax=Streptomyces sp. NPDC023327 TaxID=3157088 RepID=UPI0033D7D991